MGWQDRNYGYDRIGDARFSNPVLRILTTPLPLGTWFGIRVRLHFTLIVWILLDILLSKATDGYGLERVLIRNFVLFMIVLLHEFGHCIGARAVGGDADEVLLWPLGGLAYARPPQRPWPTFVTVAAGPFVNVIICAVTGTMLWLLGHFESGWMNPLIAFGGNVWVSKDTYDLIDARHMVGWLFWFFTTSATLFFFNLLPIYPLDGGQMLQSILWNPLGYRRSMNFACITGMVGAVIGFMVGLAAIAKGGGILMFLAISGFITCYQRRMILKETADEVEEPYDLSAAWEHPDRPARKHKIKKRWFRAVRRQASREQAEQARIDAILAKVKERGLHSLSWWEKRTLRKATERQRQRDLAERL